MHEKKFSLGVKPKESYGQSPPERFTVKRIRELMFRGYFKGFSGERCHKCKATANVLAGGGGWFCGCGQYVAQDHYNHQIPHDKPTYGPSASAIKLARDLHNGAIGKQARRKKRDAAVRQRRIDAAKAGGTVNIDEVEPLNFEYEKLEEFYKPIEKEFEEDKFFKPYESEPPKKNWWPFSLEQSGSMGGELSSSRVRRVLLENESPGKKSKRKGRNRARRGKKRDERNGNHPSLKQRFGKLSNQSVVVLPDLHASQPPKELKEYLKYFKTAEPPLDKYKATLYGTPGSGKTMLTKSLGNHDVMLHEMAHDSVLFGKK